ncbi:hypothetical protein HU200_066702 [Digitaria exilis]|uniref:Protein kinase domain-containing protein n=1 Tax=Digitaria exilis TaxID=1010633 RepID=A0A835A632_9POAL|nr:hypothetical protein HU200_066702 [Digitaria exilis]
MPPLRAAAAAALLLLPLCLCLLLASAEPDADKAALLAFLAGVERGGAARARINWQSTPLACSTNPGWTGVTCNADATRVVALHLPGLGLSGAVPPGTLGRLDALQLLSLRANNLSGAFPPDILELPNLAGLHLQRNAFSGPLPATGAGLAALSGLQVLDLSFNRFDGAVPAALSNLTHLVALNLSNNSLSGQVPDLGLPTLQYLNLSNNPLLDGPVPASLMRFADAAFVGTNVTRPPEHQPLSPPEAPPSAGSTTTNKRRGARRLSEAAILAIAVGGCVLVFAVVAVCLIAFCNREAGDEMGGAASGKKNKGGDKMGRESPESSCLVLSNELHRKRGEDRIPLDWETRVKIALGAARGIAHIHTENNGKFVHGNIKASNVFINRHEYGCISDLGLALLMNPITARSRSLGYCAPEVADTRKASQASDVYSFGVFVLELLTGKSPVQITGGGNEVVHLVRWVQSVVREEWTAEVFDGELLRYPNIEEEMVEMLQIGMACVSRTPERRPKMADVVRTIEEVRRGDTGTRPSTEASTPAVEAAQNRAESSSAAQ